MYENQKLVEEIEIENFKSIEKMKLSLGRVNVFIGENGAGKSNIIEAIAFAAAAAAEKTDNEFLAARGVRISRPELMRSAFESGLTEQDIKISIKANSSDRSLYKLDFHFSHDNEPYSEWQAHQEEDTFTSLRLGSDEGHTAQLVKWALEGNIPFAEETTQQDLETVDLIRALFKAMLKDKNQITKNSNGTLSIIISAEDDGISTFRTRNAEAKEQFRKFVIYSPENSALRTLQSEGQIVPLGVNGEGLLQFLHVLNESRGSDIKEIKDGLALFNWFSDVAIGSDRENNPLLIRDRFINPEMDWMDQRSANEGFLFVAFYLAIFTSKLTPRFFAIDNIDASLNPKLCEKLMTIIARLAKKNNKQAIMTTHNPAILDGLDITDPEQRLFVVSRSRTGRTVVRRHNKPKITERTRLSELFINGLLGGLPKGF